MKKTVSEIRAQLRTLALDRIKMLDDLEAVRWRIRNLDHQIEHLNLLLKEDT